MDVFTAVLLFCAGICAGVSGMTLALYHMTKPVDFPETDADGEAERWAD